MTLSISFPSFTPGTTIFSAQVNTNNGEIVNWANTHEAATTAVHGVSGTIVGTSDTQTLTNKTLTQPLLSGVGAGKATLQYANSANNRTITFDDPGGNDSVVYLAATQTLTNKTLTTPTIASFTNATHSHANAAGGGQLDWDNVWTDAVHDHSSAAEGGNIPEASITDGTILARVGSDETITGAWTFPSTDPPTANTTTSKGLAKIWGYVDSSGTIVTSYNVTSVSAAATGTRNVTIATDYSSSNYVIIASPSVPNGTTNVYCTIKITGAGTFTIYTFDANSNVLTDYAIFFVGFGVQ